MNIVACDRPRHWDRYVFSHPHGAPFHLFGWKAIFERIYGLSTFYLMLLDDALARRLSTDDSNPPIKGILALALINSPGNRRRLISLPYVDVAGILADDPTCEALLLEAAVRVAGRNNARWIELRQPFPLKSPIPESGSPARAYSACADGSGRHFTVSSHKAGLRRRLPADSRQLMRSFKSKLRSQIKKAFRNGLIHDVGGASLLPAFYRVFSRNMRDLGSPVHAYRLFEAVFDAFGDRARVTLVRRGDDPLAASIVLRHNNQLHNPWASSVRNSRGLGSNMLLYWSMLAHACDSGLDTFDFGRSSPGAGTYQFKRQWGATPTPLYWSYLTLSGEAVDPMAERLSFETWKHLPVWLTRLIGPPIRRHISL